MLIYVIPRDGFKVGDPALAATPSRHLPPAGRVVEASMYWARRVADGDVTLAPVPLD